MPSFSTTAPIALTIATMFGILVHDIHLDKAAALALPVMAAAYAGADAADKYLSHGNPHTHVERPSLPRSFTTFRSSLPNIQPPRDDDRRYIQNKKAHLGFGDNQGYAWPSE